MPVRVGFVLALALAGCGGGGGGAGGAGGGGGGGGDATQPVLTVSPLAPADIVVVYPLGWQNAPDHTFPTAHAYQYWRDPANPGAGPLAPPEVRAPAAGTITAILTDFAGDTKITVHMAGNCTWFLDHVALDGGFAVGQPVVAGQRLGIAGNALAVDLGIVNTEVTQPFLAPERYPDQILHADDPWSYFTPALRSELAALCPRPAAAGPAPICFDVEGTIAGNWFLDGVAADADATGDPANWPKHLAFSRDLLDPDAVRIAIGGGLAIGAGVFGIDIGDPLPETVDAAAGIVGYRLLSRHDGNLAGYMSVQLIDANTLKVQADPWMDVGFFFTPGFTGGERIYLRSALVAGG